jgi:hypothetical protein
MILYHFTGLAALIGPYGLDALEASDGPNEVDARDFAAPGSILRVGLKPGQQRRWGLDHDAKEFERFRVYFGAIHARPFQRHLTCRDRRS